MLVGQLLVPAGWASAILVSVGAVSAGSRSCDDRRPDRRRRGDRVQRRARAAHAVPRRPDAAHAARLVARGGRRGHADPATRRRRDRRRRDRRRRLPRPVDRVAPPRPRARRSTSSCSRPPSAVTARADATAASARRSGATRRPFASRSATPPRSPSAARPRTPFAGSAPGARRTTSTPGSGRRRCSASRPRSRSSDRGTRACAAAAALGAPEEVVSVSGRGGPRALRVAALPRRRPLPA